LLEHDVDGFNDANLRICLAIDDYFMFELFRSGDIEVMLLGEAVVPAAVPGGEPVGVSLPCTRERGTGQCLHIDIPVGVRVGGEVGLRLNLRVCS
jgi:hypothetical protein